jgi:hypothetical protein
MRKWWTRIAGAPRQRANVSHDATVPAKAFAMFGLTQLGAFHTAISLIAVGAGAVSLVPDRRITSKNTPGKSA